MARKPFELTAGAVVPGTKWRLGTELARGGMGVTWHVEKPPGIRGVMKAILPELASTGSYVRRFLDEVTILTQLDHPNIVQVFDFDLLEDGTPFFVMERLQGKTLGAAMKSTSNTTGRRVIKALPARIAYEITRQVCEALYRAHSLQPKGVVHRDLKPDNIFIHHPGFGADPIVKLLDFGVAAFEEAKRESGPVGTPRYMSPEQLRCEDITFKADLYAMGLVLYEMLVGRGPFDDRLAAATPAERAIALVKAHLSEEPPPPSRFAPWIPKTIDALVLSALEKDPSARPVSAYALVAKLYELQFVNDGTPREVADANTTAPTLVRLTEDDEELAAAAAAPVNDTVRDEIPVAEIVHTAKMNADPFASTTPKMDPVALPVIDRQAPTRLSPVEAPKPRVARHDTEPMASRRPRPDNTAEAEEAPVALAETPFAISSTSAGVARSASSASSAGRTERTSNVRLVVAVVSASVVAAVLVFVVGQRFRHATRVAAAPPPIAAQAESAAPLAVVASVVAPPVTAEPASSVAVAPPSSGKAPAPRAPTIHAAPPKPASPVPSRSTAPPASSKDDLVREM